VAKSDEISVTELSEILANDPKTPLIDVREQEEFDEVNLAGKLIPMSELETRWQEIPKEDTVYIYCRTGRRSRTAIDVLRSKGYGNCVNVTGGIMAWLNEVNPEGRSA
jgi:rhodanese-related sulfurtransferase